MRIQRVLVVGVVGAGLLASYAVSQFGGSRPGPPRYELGQILPPPLVDALDLTPEQQKELDAIQKDIKQRLEKLLTDKQIQKVENFRMPPSGPPRNAGNLDFGPEPVNPSIGPRIWVQGALKIAGDDKNPVVMTGDAREGPLGDKGKEINGRGIRFLSADDINQDGRRAAEAVIRIQGIQEEMGRWFRVRINGLAQPGFSVDRDDLYLKVEFFKDQGKNSLDFIKKSFYPQIEQERNHLVDGGTNKNLGNATWRNYSFAVRTPFKEVDTLAVTVGFGNGTGRGQQAEFWLREIEVTPIPDPADYLPPQMAKKQGFPPALKDLVKIGGHWYYDPRGGSKVIPSQFDHTNVDRLYYLTDRLETPFVGNVSAWLRRGYLDRDGNPVQKDRMVLDSVVLSFTDTHLIMKSKNLPNHPVAVFPDRSRFLDGNPNIIREQRDTWAIPLEPRVRKQHPPAMTQQNRRGLPMGPIGVALNGVVFFNPFDADTTDAVWRLDRCCGHPSPGNEYHYHKYPVCINTPWADDGTAHSPLIGFAFDGFPVYGPYEAPGVLARDCEPNPLNDYNLHSDAFRGPHYHVTPGRFPHILGGYWGEVENRLRPPR